MYRHFSNCQLVMIVHRSIMLARRVASGLTQDGAFDLSITRTIVASSQLSAIRATLQSINWRVYPSEKRVERHKNKGVLRNSMKLCCTFMGVSTHPAYMNMGFVAALPKTLYLAALP